MMKSIKFAFISFLTFLLIFHIAKISHAQTTPTPSTDTANQLNILLQGTSCGNLNQQCCTTGRIDIPEISVNLPDPFSALNPVIKSGFSYFTENVAEPLINTISNFIYSSFEINNGGFCKNDTKASDVNNPANCTCISEALANASRLCLGITSGERGDCLSCVTSQQGIWTAIGCVQSDLGTFISQKLLGWGVGLAGIIAMLCIIYSAFQLQTSRGNPEKIKKAQELLTSCIMGLMLIIFSVFILRLIGVNILRIPGLQ